MIELGMTLAALWIIAFTVILAIGVGWYLFVLLCMGVFWVIMEVVGGVCNFIKEVKGES